MSRRMAYDSDLRDHVEWYMILMGRDVWIIESELEEWLLTQGRSIENYDLRKAKYLMRSLKMVRTVIDGKVVWFRKKTPKHIRLVMPG